uniref:Secreted protein n=1 Tax=Cyclopterus lumpus TaxID=8103 RepID=A0A8C3A358_CYCLU
MTCVRSPVFCLHIKLIHTGFLIVHNALHSDFPRVWVHAEELAHLEGCVPAKSVGHLSIGALIKVCGVQLQHQRPPRSVKYGYVIVGVQHCDSYQCCTRASR